MKAEKYFIITYVKLIGELLTDFDKNLIITNEFKKGKLCIDIYIKEDNINIEIEVNKENILNSIIKSDSKNALLKHCTINQLIDSIYD